MECAALSPDGSTLFCGNLHGSLYAFDVKPSADRLEMREEPTVLHMNPHGESAENGRPLPILAMAVLPRGWGHRSAPVLLTSAEGRSARRGSGGSICAWDVRSRERLRVTIMPHPGCLYALAFAGQLPNRVGLGYAQQRCARGGRAQPIVCLRVVGAARTVGGRARGRRRRARERPCGRGGQPAD